MPAPDKDGAIRRRVMVGTASNYAGQIIAFASLFFLTPFILRHLGAATYGLWVLVSSIVAYGSVLDLGVWGAIIKYVAEYRARGEADTARALLATALRLYTLFGAGVLALAAMAALLMPPLFGIAPDQRPLASQLIMLMGVGVGVSLPGLMPLSVLRGLQRYDVVSVIEISATLTTTAATVLGLLLGGGVLAVVAANLLGLAVMALGGAWGVQRLAPAYQFGWRGADRRLARQIITYSWPLSVKDVAGRLQNRSDEITIGAFLPIASIAPYNVARRLSESTYVLTRQFMKVLLPLASELHAENDLGRLRRVFLLGTRVTLALALLIGLTLIVLARPILTAWVGPDYASAAGLVAILTTASFLAAAQWPAGAVLQGMARHRVLAATALGSGLANLALSIALVRPLGVTGVALGTLLPALAEFAIILPYTLQRLGLNGRAALAEVFWPALAPAALQAVALYALRQFIQPTGLLPVLAIAGLGAGIFALAYWRLGANAYERATYSGLAVGVLRAWGDWRTRRSRIRPADEPR